MTLFIFAVAACLTVSAFAAEIAPRLPSRNSTIVVPLLRRLEGHPEVRQVEEILGHHDREAGSGRCIFVYALMDGSELWVSTGDCRALGWITRRREGQKDEVIFKVKEEPNQSSQPTSLTRRG